MEIKLLVNTLKKNLDRLILTIMILVLSVLTLKYISLLKEKSIVFEENELYKIVGLPPRGKGALDDEEAFKVMMEKRINHLLGPRPGAYYQNLVNRNPFHFLRDLVVMPLALKPTTLKMGVGEKFTFRPLNGIGPYAWQCEPEDLGFFTDNIFEAKIPGPGKITVTDARGHKASTEKLEIVSLSTPLVRPGVVEINLIYRGMMTIRTPRGEEVLALIEEKAKAKTHSKKVGEEIDGFMVKDITAERLILFDKNKEIELRRK